MRIKNEVGSLHRSSLAVAPMALALACTNTRKRARTEVPQANARAEDRVDKHKKFPVIGGILQNKENQMRLVRYILLLSTVTPLLSLALACSDTRKDARTEARTSERAEERVDERHDK